MTKPEGTMNCPKCGSSMELNSFTPREWVKVKTNANGAGYRNVKKVCGATEYTWMCPQSFDHSIKVEG